mgnify:CR=1 FL=1
MTAPFSRLAAVKDMVMVWPSLVRLENRTGVPLPFANQCSVVSLFDVSMNLQVVNVPAGTVMDSWPT